MTRKLHLIPVTLAAALVITGTTGYAQSAYFLQPTSLQGTAPPDKDPAVMRSMNAVVDISQLNANTPALRLLVFDKQIMTLSLTRIDPIGRRGLTWRGKVAEQPNSSAALIFIGKTVVGNIALENGLMFQIRSLGEGVHSFREVDPRKYPNETRPIRPNVQQSEPGTAADTCATDPPSDIDVMVVYTAAARTGAGGADAMEAAIYLAVEETNQSYINSAVNQRLRLAHFEEVSYTESGLFNTDLSRLQNPGDGFMDNVPVLRNTYAADATVLITETGDACGLGYFMNPVSNSFEAYAYAVVARSCATGYYSFGHELGHNMGADHDIANASASGAYPYDHGFYNTSPTSPATPWRTIMTYQTSPASTRVQYWSNPNINYPVGGDMMGNGASADNHQLLNNTALTVANFRCSSPGVTNVWMKDTWEDTGLEPDPHTAGQEMWKSPYIWVRNGQDTGLTHQHEHQNPIFGTTNWVYAKIHNGGSVAVNGNLEFYYANASVSLTWPGSWTLISSVPISSFVAHSTRVVEMPWSSLPGTGHYCMLVRWVSASDPMTFAEGPDINANVRNNNNLIWRNLNIVTMDPGKGMDVSMIVLNPDRENRTTSLTIRPPRGKEKGSFFEVGEVYATLDPALLNAWKLGGGQGTGFKMVGGEFLITSPAGARFDNLILPYKEGGNLKLRFNRLATTPRQEFAVDVEQGRPADFAAAAKLSPVIGGVSYEIHTDWDFNKP